MRIQELEQRTGLDRAWNVYTNGTCIGIPILAAFTYVQHYCTLTGRSARRFARYEEMEAPADMSWDQNTELIYESIGQKRAITVPISIILCVFSFYFYRILQYFTKISHRKLNDFSVFCQL